KCRYHGREAPRGMTWIGTERDARTAPLASSSSATRRGEPGATPAAETLPEADAEPPGSNLPRRATAAVLETGRAAVADGSIRRRRARPGGRSAPAGPHSWQ